MFEQLTSGLTRALQGLFASRKLTQDNMEASLGEIRSALLAADVHYTVARQLVEKVRTACVGQKVLEGVSPGQQVVKVIHDEITQALGGLSHDLSSERPLKILLCGLQGSGKTTTAAKLAHMFVQKGLKVVLVACDLQRPAAVSQLETLSQQAKCGFFKLSGAKSPSQVALRALQDTTADLFIFDTAGRLQLDGALMAELKNLCDGIMPQERWLVVDAALGQQAVEVAGGFRESVGLNGLVLAKFDGDARGGAVLSIRSTTGIPICYVGSGERIEDLELFNPQRMAGRILGMGDIVGLVEHAQASVDEKEAMGMTERMLADDFSLEDLLEQFRQLKKMGDMGKLVAMIPGMSGASVGDAEKKKMARSEAIILSMTRRERKSPQLIAGSRLERIAKGSGVMLKDVNALLKQFGQMRDMMRMMKGSKGREFMRRAQAMQK
jgi:signal recognition particle subunit SRP54